MAIHLDENTKVLVQGFTGQIGSFHADRHDQVRYQCRRRCYTGQRW